MGSSFFSSLIITLREGIEGALAVSIILLYLKKTGRTVMNPSVWWGVVIAVLASIGGAFILERIAISGEIVEGILMFVSAIFVGSMILWMWSAARGLKKEIENKIEVIAGTGAREGMSARLGIFLFTFFMIVREGMETVIFLSAVNLTTDALVSFLGGVLGLGLAVLFAVLFVRGSIRIDLGRFFKITGIVLLLFVIQLLIGGVHELGEAGAIPVGQKLMAIIGPIVKNNALFLMGVLLIPVLILLIPAKTQTPVESASQAERRLLLYQQRRQKMWRTSAAALSVAIILCIGYDFVYGQTRKLTPPVLVPQQDGLIRIPAATVSDGNLHRFQLEGTRIRFIALKDAGKDVAVAFDACEICGSQGYVQEGRSLICLNCSADINPSTIQQGGGCNPIPLHFEKNGGVIVIAVSELMKKEGIFP